MQLKRLVEEQQIANEKKRKDELNRRLASAHRNVTHGVEAAQWHRDAEAIKARMKKLERGAWSKTKQAAAATRGTLDTVNVCMCCIKFATSYLAAKYLLLSMAHKL